MFSEFVMNKESKYFMMIQVLCAVVAFDIVQFVVAAMLTPR